MASTDADAVRARRFGVTLLALAATALIVRIGFIVVVDPQVPRIGDASAYHLLANNLADGRGYIRPFDFQLLHRVRPTAEYPPLFPGVLSVVSFVGLKSVEAQRLAMAFVGTGTVVLIGLLGRRVGGNAVGLLAAAVAAVYPMLFLSDGLLMAETPYVLLVTLTLLLAYRAIDAPTPARFALLGVVVGLSALARAEGLLLVLLLAVPLAVTARGMGGRRRVLLAAVALGATALTVVPWTARNAVRLDAFVPVSNNVGTAVDGANCDLVYSGEQIGLWRETFSTLGEEARDRPQAQACFEGFDIEARDFDEADVASAHRSDGFDYARDHVGRLPTVMTTRWLRTWGLFRPTQQIEFETFEGRPRSWQQLGTWMYWVLLPFAVAGTVIQARRGWRAVWPLLAPVVLVSITAVLTYGQQRFRVAAEPAILVLGAVAVVALVHRIAALRRTAFASPAT